ncbi:hypothetical protein HDU76_004486, partial [Blyttiomyces sp. JEL0837]
MLALRNATAPKQSFEDVVPYFKSDHDHEKKKNIIAILIDQSKESESAFQSVLETVVPEYDPLDTQFIIVSAQLPPTVPMTPSTDNGPRQATRDFLTQRAQHLFTASYSGESSKLPPAYTTTNDIKTSPNTEKTNNAWFGHVRALYYHRDNGLEMYPHPPKSHPASTSSTSSHWTLSHDITKYILLHAKEGSVKVVKGELEEGVDGEQMVEIQKGVYAAAIADHQPPEGQKK